MIGHLHISNRRGLRTARCFGFLLGAFFVVSAWLCNEITSRTQDRREGLQFISMMAGSVLLALPLVVPWRFIRPAVLWWPLFGLLCLEFLGAIFTAISETIWAFRFGESTQCIAFPLLGAILILVMGVQIQAVRLLRKESTV